MKTHDMVAKNFWIVLPYDYVKELEGLHISPMGVGPQHERRPRIIVDYSFYDLNANTVKHAPPEAMQFGRALERLLAQIVHANPRYGPVQLIKVDIADGFYRVKVQTDDIPKLAVALPTAEGEIPLVALGNTLSSLTIGITHGLDRVPSVVLLLYRNYCRQSK